MLRLGSSVPTPHQGWKQELLSLWRTTELLPFHLRRGHILEKPCLMCITTNTASGGDGILVELFQILKDDAVKVLHSICQIFFV